MRPWANFQFLTPQFWQLSGSRVEKKGDKTIQTFKKGEKVNLNRIWKQQKQQMYCQNARRRRKKNNKKNASHRWGFYLYISCACQHQTFNVSILQRHRRKEEMQGSHCHHTIKQSSASPNSLQLSSAGTRHSHYNKHSLLMLCLHHAMLTQTQCTQT